MKWFFLFFLVFIGFFYFFPNHIPPLSPPQPQKEHYLVEKKKTSVIMNLIGKTEEEVTKQFGQPMRTDDSAYDYKWWIYNRQPQTYLQLGMLNGRVVTAFICGEQIDVAPFRIGQPVRELFDRISLSPTIEVSLPTGTYRFELSEQDMTIQPLVRLNDIYAQLYIDHFTGRISSIRIMDAKTLVKLRPYELMYRGKLLSPRPLSLEEQKRVEMANARQIFEITNVIRKRYNVPPLSWHEKAAQAAYAHSEDMKENRYFSHHSPTYGDLKDRLLLAHIPFQIAGENIAAQYVDGIAAVEGWLNSKSHRDTLLSQQFTHLGVGVAGQYYTQDFLKPWKLSGK
ncbi:CAP domain-containing protein [Anoxybacteroides tepidamans]|uniref:CAP domain-containing protein n=1 Tax=Anoxybacteroides tepidamans TaxID=265948 RepID=UPI000485CEB7|nr:CAP domain-containing protein [Anoxybacillus tepidamans]